MVQLQSISTITESSVNSNRVDTVLFQNIYFQIIKTYALQLLHYFQETFSWKKIKEHVYITIQSQISLNIQSHHNAHYLKSVMQWVSIAQNSRLLPSQSNYLAVQMLPQTLSDVKVGHLTPYFFYFVTGSEVGRNLTILNKNCKCVYHLTSIPTSGNVFRRTSPECVK